MSRYIDAENLLEKLPNDLPYKSSVKRVLMQAPSEDVVEVVRCKDCQRKQIDTFGRTVCIRNGQMIVIQENDFCSYAKAKMKGGAE